MRYNFFSYTASLEFALTRVGYYECKSYHGQARSGLGNPIFHEVRSKFFRYCNLGTNRSEQSWTNDLKANAFSNKSCYTRDVFFEVFPNSCQQNFSLPVFLFQKKILFFVKVPVVVRQSGGKWVPQRGVHSFKTVHYWSVPTYPSYSLFFKRCQGDMSDPTTSLLLRIRCPPSCHQSVFGTTLDLGLQPVGEKKMSNIYKTILSAARASREKQSWGNSNIPHDLHKEGRKGEKKWSAGSEEVTEGRPGTLL